MPQTAIFGPMLATIFLTLVVCVYMYVRRISFIQKTSLTPEQLSVPGALAELSPPEVSNSSDNFKNRSRSRSSSMRWLCICWPRTRSMRAT